MQQTQVFLPEDTKKDLKEINASLKTIAQQLMILTNAVQMKR